MEERMKRDRKATRKSVHVCWGWGGSEAATGDRGGGGFSSRGCQGEPIANICWLAASGEMDCSGTLSERQFYHHLCGPVHLVFLEHWGDLLVKGGGGGSGGVEET